MSGPLSFSEREQERRPFRRGSGAVSQVRYLTLRVTGEFPQQMKQLSVNVCAVGWKQVLGAYLYLLPSVNRQQAE